jgi:hypothetical protein
MAVEERRPLTRRDGPLRKLAATASTRTERGEVSGLALRQATRAGYLCRQADHPNLSPLSVRVEAVAANLRFAGARGG